MNEAERFLKEQLAKQQGVNGSQPGSYASTFTPTPSAAPSAAYNQPHPAPQFVGQQYRVSLGEAIKRYWTTWSLNGRASRSEYWFAILGLFLIAFPLNIIAMLLGGEEGVGIFQLVWSLANFWPLFAIVVRRLHDIGKTMILAIIVMVLSNLGQIVTLFVSTEVAGILMLILSPPGIWLFCRTLRQSQLHENQYGPVPNVKQ